MVEQIRAGVYARSSEGDDTSVDDQVRQGTREVEALGGTVVGTYVDHVSASPYAKKDRTDWPKLRRDIENRRLNMAVVRDTSRADRRVVTWVPFVDLCRTHKVKIRSVVKHRTYDPTDWDDYETLIRQGLQAEGESVNHRNRVVIGQGESYADGKPPGGRQPYGYRRHRSTTYGEGKKKTVVTQQPNPVTAPVVREVFQRIADHEPIRAIVADLNRRGIGPPKAGRGEDGTRRGRRWWPARITAMIQNPAYKGYRKRSVDKLRRAYEYESVPGSWEALVGEDLWHAANLVVARNREGVRPALNRYLLSGLITCVCDRPDHAHKHGPVCGDLCGSFPNPKLGPRYGCSYHSCSVVPILDADQYVQEQLIGWLRKPETVHHLKAVDLTGNVEYARLKGEADRLALELDKFTREAVQAGLSAARLARIEQEYQAAIREAEKAAQAAVTSPVLRLLIPANDDPRLSGYAGNLVEFDLSGDLGIGYRWAGLSLNQQREVIRAVATIHLLPGRKGKRQPAEERLTVQFG